MLSAIEDCVERIALARGETVDLSRIPLDDQGVYGEIQAADTVGTFQIESRAQMQSLLRTRPENMDDLTVQVALVRPGPIQGGAVHPYIDRRAKRRVDPSYPIEYDHPLLEQALEETFGVVVFQEQVLEVAMALAGFTIGEAEGLRRAMSRKRSLEALEAFRERFVEGAAGERRRRGDGESRLRQARRLLGLRLSPSRTPLPSRCSRTSRRGCAATTRWSSSARCSTPSRWASTRRPASSATRSGAA